MAFFISCNVLNRKNKRELENYDKYGSLGDGAHALPPVGFSVTLQHLRVPRVKLQTLLRYVYIFLNIYNSHFYTELVTLGLSSCL